MPEKFKAEIKKLLGIVKSMDKKVVTVLIGVAVLQTVSYYFTSRRFFRLNFYYQCFDNDPNANLYEYLFWFFGDFISLFVIASLVIKFILKEKIKDFGVRWGDYKTGFLLTAIFLLVMLPLLWWTSSMPAFASKYPHLQSAKSDWIILAVFETGMFFYMFGWEFIWRGFMLFGLEEKFGYYAVLIQMIPFVILHNGKPEIETFSAILGGIALGILAFRTRSFIYGVFVHFGIMFFIDLISTLRFRANDFGLGFGSIINVLKELF